MHYNRNKQAKKKLKSTTLLSLEITPAAKKNYQNKAKMIREIIITTTARIKFTTALTRVAQNIRRQREQD